MNTSVNILTIAGSDPGGGAGIQADLRVFCHLGLHGLSAITALTAQNTKGVQAVFPVPIEQLTAQLDSIITDMQPNATKTGMLSNAGSIEAVAELAAAGRLGLLVVDPVLVSTSGAMLTEDGCFQLIKMLLLPVCRLVTPNLHEAAALTGITITDEATAMDAARMLVDLGAESAVVTGGHWEGMPVDYLYDGAHMHTLSGNRIDAGVQFHGTGCLFSAAAASYLALGNEMLQSVVLAKQLVEQALADAYSPGNGMRIPLLPRCS